MPYRKDRFGEKLRLVRRARENVHFAEKDRRPIERPRARLRKLEGSAPKSKGSGRAARKSGTVSKTYLVPIDFSERCEIALQHAHRMSRENGGKLVLLHVINENMFHSRRIVPKRHTEKLARDELKRLAARARLEPGGYKTVIAWGRDPARTIANHAKNLHASMIIMGNQGRTGLTRLMLGSVAERTLRYAECPVLVVKTK
jgi:nucleotide-binding universal stress UspA family protein